MYTPFVVATSLILPEEGNSNIKITNGKIINNGINNILLGITSPGLEESLKLSNLTPLNKITISYDTEKFELPTIYNIATSNLLNESDLSILKELTSIEDKAAMLQNGIDQIESGSEKLLAGTKQINDITGSIYTNVHYINNIINEVKNGNIDKIDGLIQTLEKLQSIKDYLNNANNDESLANIIDLLEKTKNMIDSIKKINDNLFAEYYQNNLDSYTYDEVLEMDPTKNLYNIKYNFETNYKNNQELIELLSNNLKTLEQNKDVLTEIYNNVEELIEAIKPVVEALKREIANIDTTKENIYNNGLWHRSVHIWVMNDDQELLVQKRNPMKKTFPNLWAISSAGHVMAGESSVESGLRELKEELDIDAKPEELEYLFTIKRVQPYRDSYIRVFDDVYLLRRNLDVRKTKLQVEELTDIKFVYYEYLNSIFKNGDTSYVPYTEEHEKLFKILENRNLEII